MPQPPLPETKAEQARAYLRAMLEIKARFEAIKSVRSKSGWPPGLVAEVCHLQLRHICDLVTAASLIVHGERTPDIISDYKVPLIFKKLDRKYVQAFPKPAIITSLPHATHILRPNTGNPLTQPEFVKLWEVSGNFLHRLDLKKFFRPDAVIHAELSDLGVKTKRLWDLLNRHAYRIQLRQGVASGDVFAASLVSSDGNVEVFFLEFPIKGGDPVRHNFTMSEPTNLFRA